MKTVSGEVDSFKSISLKKAAKTLSNFASSDNGASPAYLKRAAASFNELVQLYKESKSSGSEHKVKKQRSTDIASEGTGGSVINGGDEGLTKESRWVSKSEGEARRSNFKTEVQKVEGIVDGNVVDVGGAGKKSKKKREDNRAVTFKNKPSDVFDAIDMNGLEHETENHDVSEDKRKKKKKKRDKSERVNCSVPVDIEMEAHKSCSYQQKHKNAQPYSDHAPMNAIEVSNEIESFDGSIDMKKKKKKKKNKNKVDGKEERVSSVINGDE